jgi:hypothetical protein
MVESLGVKSQWKEQVEYQTLLYVVEGKICLYMMIDDSHNEHQTFLYKSTLLLLTTPTFSLIFIIK